MTVATSPAAMDGAQLAEVCGLSLEVSVHGSGPALLFLHGMDGVEEAADLIGELAKDFEVHAPSHPGFGSSELPASFDSVDDIAYAYLDYLETRDLRDVVVVGACFGGWVAAEILIKATDRVSRLVLAAPLGIRTGWRREQYVPDIFTLPPAEADARLRGASAPPVKLDQLPEQQLARVIRNKEAVSLFGWRPYLYDPKLEDRLYRIKTPTLVLWGDKDGLTPADYARRFSSAIPGAEFRVVPGSGHRLYADQPARLAQEVLAFSGQAQAHAQEVN